MRPEGERLALASFLGGSLLAGANAVCIRFSNRELEPLWGAGLRFALAAAALVVVMLALRLRLPRGRALVGTLLYGSLAFGAAFALVYYALVEVQAGFGQVLLALVPLATLLLAVLQRQERLGAAGIAGAAIALFGVGVMSREPLRAGVPLSSLLAGIGSALCVAQAAIVVRRFPRVHPVTMNALGMATGAVLLLAGSLLVRETMVLPRRIETVVALGYLVLVGSMLVFALYLVVLRYWSASRASYQFAIIPLVTIGLSVWLDDERITWSLAIGGLLAIAGVYLGALRPTRGPAPARAGAETS